MTKLFSIYFRHLRSLEGEFLVDNILLKANYLGWHYLQKATSFGGTAGMDLTNPITAVAVV